MTYEEAHSAFEYVDGKLYWKISPAYQIKKGSQAGTHETDNGKYNYPRIVFNGKSYLTHRIVYLMHHGYMPKFIDHIDGVINNNKIENLRPTTKSTNAMNKGVRMDSSTGIKNVVFKSARSRYEVYLTVDGVRRFIGSTKDIEFAELMSIEAEDKFYGQYAYRGHK